MKIDKTNLQEFNQVSKSYAEDEFDDWKVANERAIGIKNLPQFVNNDNIIFDIERFTVEI